MRFRRIDPAPSLAHQIHFEGTPIPFAEGDTVAGALLAAGIGTFRTTPVTGAPRAPYCLMGSCFDCLMRIDGAENRRACMTPASDGMQVERARGPRPAGEERMP